jgi:hypothetical protein
MWKYVLAWIPMVFIAIINGAIREGWYGKHVGELQAHQISTVTGVLLFGVYIWLLLRIWRPASAGQALTISRTHEIRGGMCYQPNAEIGRS